MRNYFVIVYVMLTVMACQSRVVLKNETRHAGYAMGEEVRLSFSVVDIEHAPDSILVGVIERKSGYHYSLVARKRNCTEVCPYEVTWDGRKADGSWPMGGRYLVFANTVRPRIAYSDTVEIGLAD